MNSPVKAGVSSGNSVCRLEPFSQVKSAKANGSFGLSSAGEVGAFAAGGWAVVGASGAGAGCAKAWCSAATSPASASTQVHCVRRNNRNIVDSSTGGFRNKEDKKTHP